MGYVLYWYRSWSKFSVVYGYGGGRSEVGGRTVAVLRGTSQLEAASLLPRQKLSNGVLSGSVEIVSMASVAKA